MSIHPIGSPEMTAALKRINANRVTEPSMTDADRMAWMDGMPVGFFFDYDTEKVNLSVARHKTGWVVSFYFNGGPDLERTVATFREAIDLIAEPQKALDEFQRNWEARLG